MDTMETVNFQCGHCGNLMAVGVEFLGQQIRCPTCQQVVIAPADAVQPPPLPLPDVPFPPLSPNEEIPLPAPTESVDALFNSVPPLESPTGDTIPLSPAADGVFGHAPFLPPVEPASAPTPEGIDTTAPMISQPATESSPSPEPLTHEPLGIRKPRDYSGRVNYFIPLVFLPLLLYAVLSTAVAGYLYVKLRAQPASPFDSFPDWEGDTPGTRKDKPKLSYDRKFTTLPLPEQLLVGLGQTIRVGDLEVTPLRVERRKVELVGEGTEEKGEQSPTDGLVLHLRLKNLADDYAFTPMDNFFDRHWKPGNDGVPPLTLLQAGVETFYGGPAKWRPLGRGRKERREWLAGRKNIDREGLSPGQDLETVVATDAWDAAVAQHLFGVDDEGHAVRKPYVGKLLWRVQLRRGLVEWKGRKLPATAVVGVEFTDSDYAEKAG